MPEADDDALTDTGFEELSSAVGEPRPGNDLPDDTSDGPTAVDPTDTAGLAEEDFAEQVAGEDGAAEDDSEGEGGVVLPTIGPGKIRRAVNWLFRWHPLLFLGAALALMAVAWRVYPEPEQQYIPPAEGLYREGLDRLYRVMNPDLTLRAATPLDEALAARNAFLNLFIFHRGDLAKYPEFINPYMLLAEANYHIAELAPELADKHFADAQEAYKEALIWERREDDPHNLALYIKHNYLDPSSRIPDDSEITQLLGYFEENEDIIAERRQNRENYIQFRQAEADIRLGHPDAALPILERTAREERASRRDQLRNILSGDSPRTDISNRAFELGPDEYKRLPLLLALAYDKLGRIENARTEYRTYLADDRGGRDRISVLSRLARISLEDGNIYATINPAQARESLTAAAEFYDQIVTSPNSTNAERDDAILGSAKAYSALAKLAPQTGKTVIDEIADVGSTIRSWLEDFSGQTLPTRALALPSALGSALANTENIVPGPFALPSIAFGETAAMAGGEMETPYSMRRQLLESAIQRYDRIAETHPGTDLANRAAVTAAQESRAMGFVADAERRFKRLMDPLLSPEVNLAARLGLAAIALDRGDLREADLLVMGGRAHPMPLWLVPDDTNWQSLAARLGNPSNRNDKNAWLRVWETINQEGKDIASYVASGRSLDLIQESRFLKAMNFLLRQRDFYKPEYFADIDVNPHLAYLLGRNIEFLTEDEIVWRNRLLLEAAWSYDLAQRGSRENRIFSPFPPASELDPTGLTPPAEVADLAIRLARGWSASAAELSDLAEKYRRLVASANAYQSAVEQYRADPGVLLPELAQIYESQAETREGQNRHDDALDLTARAGRTYLSVASRARGSPREMDSLLSAADAFFRSGLLERTIEAVDLFMDRFGYTAAPGSEISMATAQAENLMGRAHWFLGDYDQAKQSFIRNIKRRTPERYKSIYYVGRVMMDEAETPGGDLALLGDVLRPLPNLDRDGDPVIESALQAFNFLRQEQGVNPMARAWRWSTFDLARLYYIMADQARRQGLEEIRQAQANLQPGEEAPAVVPTWLDKYDTARQYLTEALERYPLRTNGGPGLSVRVEPEDYADLMAARFETEYMLASTLMQLAQGREDDSAAALARAHLANLSDPNRYAEALFDPALDRFQLNAAVIREAVDGGTWDNGTPLPRTRLGDDEGPTHSPAQMRELLKNSMLLLASEYFRAAETAQAENSPQPAVEGLYRQAYDAYQAIYDRFGPSYGSQAMLGMADVLSRLGNHDAAANHYRMAENIARMQPQGLRADGLLDIGPDFWGQQAAYRLQDQASGYRVP